MPWGFAAAAVGSVAGAAISSNASGNAADTQLQGSREASGVQRDMFQQSSAMQAPFRSSGYAANDTLSRLLGIAPTAGMVSSGGGMEPQFDAASYLQDNPDVAADPWASQHPYEHYMGWGRNEGRTLRPATTGAGGGALDGQGYASDNTGLETGYLSQTFGPEQFKANMDPSYAWRLQQGNQGVMNANAAGSGSLSGAALKALTNYNSGAASTEYGNAFDRFQTQQGNIFQRLTSLSTLGQNAAANTGAQGVATGTNIGGNIVGGANAAAAGQVGAANAISGSLSDLGGLAYLYAKN